MRARVGPPVELKYRSPDADTKRIMKAIVDLLPPEARQHHEPTEEELRLDLPAAGTRATRPQRTPAGRAPTDRRAGTRCIGRAPADGLTDAG